MDSKTLSISPKRRTTAKTNLPCVLSFPAASSAPMTPEIHLVTSKRIVTAHDDDDDDDSLYAVGAQARLHPLRAYWERRDQENPSLEADDSGMSGEESELERMLTGGADSVSDDTLSDMDVDYSDDDADLYLPVRSTSKLGPISYRMDRRS
ncbi:hypothetical protein OBBRIDRAFT_360306 [Obba rivulosa]|uniref:Uncharacterized protein n=1 Tax=Obba rivulosa TaxID=1052685 RepID=A0A8E2DUT0_9APHY|nr:hypothetical protein OBBRIDRAFT_360306 [Obba rivulosa]